MAHRGPVTAGVVVLALALAGCTGPEPDATPESLPLDGYRAAMAAASDFFHADEGRLLREELIATCMAEHGFEYVPSLRPTGLGPVLAEGVYSEELGLVVGSREYAERYGYGTTTRPLGDPMSAYLAETAEWVDPDLAYLASMSPVERRAYDLALLGEQKEWTAADWENAEAVADLDCREEARYDAIELEVRHEYEREFVASHRAELERWLLTASVETGLGTD